MKQEIIRIAKEAEDSYSFAVGDEMRRSLMAPWRIPIFPLSMIKRIATHRKILKENREMNSITDCVFIFDLEKMRLSDQKSFTNQA